MQLITLFFFLICKNIVFRFPLIFNTVTDRLFYFSYDSTVKFLNAPAVSCRKTM